MTYDDKGLEHASAPNDSLESTTDHAEPSASHNPPDDAAAVLESALDYLRRGFSVVPQRAGDKHPCIKWKTFQQRRPTADEWIAWSQQFPDAGVAVVLGPVSGLFAIDVDSPDAHAVLIARLGGEPITPKSLSGSGKPFRYHLFFRHPAVATRAKITPWHPQLEFRGDKGILVLPPSLHKSGKRYQWAPAQSLDDVALPEVPAAVLEALRERANSDAGLVRPTADPTSGPADLPRIQARARAYLAGMPPAIQGEGGDMLTFQVACSLMIGFGLSQAEALPLLREYNGRCRPSWSEAELLYKLQEADKRPGPRGTLLAEEAPDQPKAQRGGQVRPAGAQENRQSAPVFAGVVPDFIQADWLRARPRGEPRNDAGQRRPGRSVVGGGGSLWAVHLAVVAQRSARVVLPDVLLGQVFWGGEKNAWPSNWRARLLRRLKRLTDGPRSLFVEVDLDESHAACRTVCPMYESHVPHRHFFVLIRTEHDVTQADCIDDEGLSTEDAWLQNVFLGALEVYGYDDDISERVYDFTLHTQREGMDEETFKALTRRVQRFRSAGRLAAVYLPLRLFGGSARLGLSFRQRQLLSAVQRELTRDTRSTRIDKAQVIAAGGRGGGGADHVTIDDYPGLQNGRRYVGFNGNGGPHRVNLKGRGYRILGDWGWLVRARYAYLDDAADMWKDVRTFLKDLRLVGETFGLVVACRHRRTGEWLGLEDMLERTRTEAGRKWLEECALRVYTEEDYLHRWRQVIAERLGFTVIPERDQEHTAAVDPSASAVQLTAYLRAAGVSRTELAQALGMSKSLLSQYMTGKKTWTAAWRERLNAWLLGARQRRATVNLLTSMVVQSTENSHQ